MKVKKLVVWASPVPTNCHTCDTPITDKFYDAVTVVGPWALMCPSCHNLGPGRGMLGTGYGQEYTKQHDGKFIKTAG